MGQPLADKYPLYGRDAHRTRAGIHADGLNKPKYGDGIEWKLKQDTDFLRDA